MALKDKERKEIKTQQSIRVLDNSDYLVIIPLSYKAMMVYGAGTKWCFNTDDENIFNSYSEEGPLFIIINKKTQDKFILHLETEGIKDILCREVNYNLFWKKHPSLRLLFIGLVENNTYKQYTKSEQFVINNDLNKTEIKIPKMDLSSSGYSNWKNECYLIHLENGIEDEFDLEEVI